MDFSNYLNTNNFGYVDIFNELVTQITFSSLTRSKFLRIKIPSDLFHIFRWKVLSLNIKSTNGRNRKIGDFKISCQHDELRENIKNYPFT